MKTTVVNIKHDEYDVYIGRPNRFKGLQGSIFANQFTISGSGGRQAAIAQFRNWFYDKLLSDAEFKAELEKLRGKRLGCWCKPEACHGDVIAEYLNDVDKDAIATVKKTPVFCIESGKHEICPVWGDPDECRSHAECAKRNMPRFYCDKFIKQSEASP